MIDHNDEENRRQFRRDGPIPPAPYDGTAAPEDLDKHTAAVLAQPMDDGNTGNGVDAEPQPSAREKAHATLVELMEHADPFVRIQAAREVLSLTLPK